MGAYEPFVGEIVLFAGNFAPQGWSFCNGALLSISPNTALFSLLGTTYGGNGVSTFALPDLRGRVPMKFGQGPGLTFRSQGEIGGSETTTLLPTQIPAHNHLMNVQSGTGSTNLPAGNTWAASLAGVKNYATAAAASPSGLLAPAALQTTGGGQPHNNMQPVLGLNFIIALQGVYPPH